MSAPEKAGGSRKPGTWKPGQSGNPAGRKPGLSSAAALRERLAKEMDPIIDAVVTAAKAGDLTACRLVLERVLPALKPIELPQVIPMPEGGGMLAMAERVMLAVGQGTIAAGQAAAILGALEKLAKVRETEELEQRLTKIERKLGK